MTNECDKCGKPVPFENNTIELMFRLGAISAFEALCTYPRHFLPVDGCEGSPSRAQYIEGQPRDTRGYPYVKAAEAAIRETHRQMVAEAADRG